MSLASSLQALCGKLGIKDTCITEAIELHELLQTRVDATSLRALRLPGSCQLVVCLDLATKRLDLAPAKSDIVRLSGLSKKGYSEAFSVISSLLGVETRLTLSELAVLFGCSKLVPQAAGILQRYMKSQCTDIAFEHPMFLCAALHLAARNEKVKIDSVKLRERAETTKARFDRLTALLQHYVVEREEPKKGISKRRRGGLMDAIETQIEEDERQAKMAKSDTDGEEFLGSGDDQKSEYDEWKRKILEKAAKASTQ